MKEAYRRWLPDSLSPLIAMSFPQAAASANIFITPGCKASKKHDGNKGKDNQLDNRSDFLGILQNARPGETVMIHAAAGFGKSSLLTKTVIEWQKGNVALRRYRYLYLLQVRKITNHTEVPERIMTKDINLLKASDAAKVRLSLKFSSKLCLFIVDGFDVMNDAVREITVLNDLITRKHDFINLFTTIHDGNFRRHSSMNVTIK